jgi:hypothetical protein
MTFRNFLIYKITDNFLKIFNTSLYIIIIIIIINYYLNF